VSRAMTVKPAPNRTASEEADESVLFDFESGTYDGWTVEGSAFGESPFPTATVAEWRADRTARGWEGDYLVLTGDTRHATTPDGRLFSAPFLVTKPYLTFRFGGELNPRVRVCLLSSDGNLLLTAYANNSYDLRRRGWDVSNLMGTTVRLLIEDTAPEPSLLRVDHFCLSDTPAPPVWADGQGNAEQEAGLLRPDDFTLALAADPDITGRFIFHTSLARGRDDRWHLYAAAGPERYGQATHLLHAVADRLTGPYTVVHPRMITPDPAFGERFVRDPFVLVHDGTYYLYYVGSGDPWEGWDKNTQGPYGMHLATSRDGQNWTRHSDTPLFTDTPFAFTPYVRRIGETWAMYYAGTEPAVNDGAHVILCRTSTDLVHWSERRVVFARQSKTPWIEHSFVQNPVVFERAGTWYLLCGPLGNRNQSRFHYRVLFSSDSPFHWNSDENERSPLGGLFVEGGANIIENDGRWYITHSGPYAGGVWIAPLRWMDEEPGSTRYGTGRERHP
jgi:arabinan endo-1,5-alpha-L-arabinosidase